MSSFINPPDKIPFYLKIGIWIAKRKTGMDLLPARLLAWYPKAALSSGLMEIFIADGQKDLNTRILKLVRVQTSLMVSCSFCIDMNSFEYEKDNVSEQEINALKNNISPDLVDSFSLREKIALRYSRCMSETPPVFPDDFINDLNKNFTEKEIVILASTIAQVNYWARLIQGLGIPPAGFSKQCNIKVEVIADTEK